MGQLTKMFLGGLLAGVVVGELSRRPKVTIHRIRKWRCPHCRSLFRSQQRRDDHASRCREVSPNFTPDEANLLTRLLEEELRDDPADEKARGALEAIRLGLEWPK